MEKEIIINQSLNSNQLLNANMFVYATSKLKYFFILILSVVIFNTLINVIEPFGFNNESKGIDILDFVPLLITLLVPFLIWYSLKKQSKKILTDKSRFFNNVNYIFTKYEFKIDGEDFKITYKWDELFKVKEAKNWFFIYINAYQAIAIDKKQQEEKKLTEFKEFINSLKIKKSLK